MYLGGSPYTQTQGEIEARLGDGRPRKAKRHFMWLDYLKAHERGSDRRRTRTHFKTAVARDRVVTREEAAARARAVARDKAVARERDERDEGRST